MKVETRKITRLSPKINIDHTNVWLYIDPTNQWTVNKVIIYVLLTPKIYSIKKISFEHDSVLEAAL